jgi:acyl-CoA synthetase (AMP-forming)/AMP-acid ligase II
MIEWLGPIVHEYYSSTETIGFVHCTSVEWLAHKGTVGRSLLGPVHVVGDDGAELPVGREGTIYFERSDFEYHGDTETTAGARDDRGRGWSTVGDVGYLDDDGFLYLTDRRAFMIISGGVNVYPQEAENVLAVHPKVADVAVFGIPDDDLGERVHAVVQLIDGVLPSGAVEAELLDHCRGRLAHLKCPRSIDFREVLPREETGKLYKRLLRSEYWGDRTLTG